MAAPCRASRLYKKVFCQLLLCFLEDSALYIRVLHESVVATTLKVWLVPRRHQQVQETRVTKKSKSSEELYVGRLRSFNTWGELEVKSCPCSGLNAFAAQGSNKRLPYLTTADATSAQPPAAKRAQE